MCRLPAAVHDATVKIMPKPLPKSLRETCKMLVYQGIRNDEICLQTGVKPGALKTWINRYGWRRRVTESRAMLVARGLNPVLQETTANLANASARLRSELSEELGEQVSAIRGKKVSQDMKALSHRADVVNTITHTASKVFGWDSQNDQRMVNITLLAAYDQPDPEPQRVIEADASQ